MALFGIFDSAPPAAADYSGAMRSLESGMNRTMGQLGKDADKALGYTDALSAENILANAGRFRQDANAYENQMTAQGVLATYGGDPLGAGARSGITEQLAHLNRQNYQQGLDNARGVIGDQTGAKLGVMGNLMEGRAQLGSANAQGIASLAASQAESNAASKDNRGYASKIFGGLF